MKHKFHTEPPVKILEPAVLLRINQKYQKGLSPEELYRITRGEWVISERRSHAKYAFAVYDGVILEVYEIQRWLPFTGHTPGNRLRWCFDGIVAEDLQHYIGGSVKYYFTHGNRNPVKFVNCL